jgi:hypothetical protein
MVPNLNVEFHFPKNAGGGQTLLEILSILDQGNSSGEDRIFPSGRKSFAAEAMPSLCLKSAPSKTTGRKCPTHK